jgi:hypothetical protein
MLRKIISGGQTGADRASLDFAIEKGLEHGGYVPRGRKAEDGRIDDRYNLVQLSTSSYPARTRRNIEESDGTVIFSLERLLSGGTKLTWGQLLHGTASLRRCTRPTVRSIIVRNFLARVSAPRGLDASAVHHRAQTQFECQNPPREYVNLVFSFLRIKADFQPIFACFNLIRRIHSQLINRSTPYRRFTQQLEPFSVEIKMLLPCILARVE